MRGAGFAKGAGCARERAAFGRGWVGAGRARPGGPQESRSSSEEGKGQDSDGIEDSDSEFMPPGRRRGPPRLTELDAVLRARLVAHVLASRDPSASKRGLVREFRGVLEAEGLQVTLQAVLAAFKADLEWCSDGAAGPSGGPSGSCPPFLPAGFCPVEATRKMALLQRAQDSAADAALQSCSVNLLTCSLLSVLRAATDTGVLGPRSMHGRRQPLQRLTSVAYLGWRSRTDFRIAAFEPPSHVELIARFSSWRAALDAAWRLFLEVVREEGDLLALPEAEAEAPVKLVELVGDSDDDANDCAIIS